jgi:hypothetical protein
LIVVKATCPGGVTKHISVGWLSVEVTFYDANDNQTSNPQVPAANLVQSCCGNDCEGVKGIIITQAIPNSDDFVPVRASVVGTIAMQSTDDTYANYPPTTDPPGGLNSTALQAKLIVYLEGYAPVTDDLLQNKSRSQAAR